MPTFIPGYLISFELDTDETVSLSADSVALAYGSATLAKPTFGARAQSAIAGQTSGTFTASGHGSIEVLAPLLGTLRAATAPVQVLLQYGAVPTNGGNDAFAMIIGEITTDASADGQLSWTLNGVVTGEVVFTPVAPS